MIAPPLFILFVLIVIVLASALRVLREYERGVIFRLGRLVGAKGPGLIFLIPVIDRMVKVSLRVLAMDVPPQDVITRDNVTVKVNAVLYFKVLDAEKAVVAVEKFLYATSQMAQTTLRSVLGEHDLDDLLANREKINQQLQSIIDERTDPWGVKVTAVEVKDVDLPQEMQRAIARQAEAERERRAKVIHADGEFQAAGRLTEAAQKMAVEPVAIQLRYLQTLTEVSAEKNSTIIFPLPLEMIEGLFRKLGGHRKGEVEPPAVS
ncbi:MAG: slipin family protein [Candidatus Eisenbacteria bacterium]|nr:slipin family protein [Candidatus Eisenbacteria bacterium]